MKIRNKYNAKIMQTKGYSPWIDKHWELASGPSNRSKRKLGTTTIKSVYNFSSEAVMDAIPTKIMVERTLQEYKW